MRRGVSATSRGRAGGNAHGPWGGRPSARDTSGHSQVRVTLVISSLAAGGAERVLSMMGNYWAARRWPVTLVTFAPLSEDHFALHPKVERVALNATGVSRSRWAALRHNVRRVARLRTAIRAARPQAVISFGVPTTILAVLAARPERVPVIVSERTDPTRDRIPRFWAVLRRLVYPRASAVVVQTPEVRRWAEKFLPPAIVHAIPNPVVAPPTNVAAPGAGPAAASDAWVDESAERACRQVVAVGRLDVHKAFDLLIRAFATCRVEHPDWRLVIIGEGDQREALEVLAAELGVGAAVSFLGRVAHPASVMRQSDLFVLSSRYEGFPNVLLEAMAAGLPVIATDCRSGPSHIVRDGVDGVLVPPENVDALAAAMSALMGDRTRREELGARAVDVTERFALDRIMGEWERLLSRVVGATGAREGA